MQNFDHANQMQDLTADELATTEGGLTFGQLVIIVAGGLGGALGGPIGGMAAAGAAAFGVAGANASPGPVGGNIGDYAYP